MCAVIVSERNGTYMSILYNNSILLARTSLDYAWKELGVISENIANVETPNYKTKTLNFEDALRSKLFAMTGEIGSGIDGKLDTPVGFRSMKKSEFAEAVRTTEANVVINNEDSSRSDGNNVEIDAENAEMVRVQYQYQYMSRLVTDEFTRLKSVITGQ